MPEPDATRLDDLKRRWAQDPGSRLYLQLADEHRKHGHLGEAESVLEKGLEHRPSDLSGLVALGRCRLDLGKLDGAIAALETVIARDPGHMVANKLLVEAHLQRGDAAEAGERLKTYRLFNDRDPEVDELEGRLRQLCGETSPPAVESPAAAGPLPDEILPEGPEIPVEPRLDPPTEAVAAAAEPVVAAEPAVEEPPVAMSESVAAISIVTPSNGDQIFRLGAIPPPPSLEALWPRAAPARRLAEPFSGLTAAASGALVQGEIFRIEPRAAGFVLDARRAEIAPPPAEPAAEKKIARLEPPAGLEEEAPTEQVEIVAPPAAPEEEAPTERVEVAAPPAAPEEEAPTEKIEIRPPAAAPPAAAEEEEAATVTLGGLYLKQGHREEAARIFERVLEREPQNPAALAGLNLARAPRQPAGYALTAMDLLPDRARTGARPMGLTGKKLQVLTNYLQHIRSARERDHVH